jgi:hypothetical protein
VVEVMKLALVWHSLVEVVEVVALMLLPRLGSFPRVVVSEKTLWQYFQYCCVHAVMRVDPVMVRFPFLVLPSDTKYIGRSTKVETLNKL